MIIDKLVALFSYENDPNNEREQKAYESGLGDVQDAITKVGAFALKTAGAVVALSTTFAVMASRTAVATDEVGKFADATGLSFQEIQRLTYAATLFGGSQDTVISTLDNLQQKLQEYKRGTGDFQVLGQIGVSVQGVDALGFIDRLADRFKDFDRGKAQELGRKLGLDRNFIRLLQEGTDGIQKLKNQADELNIILGDDVAANSAELVDSQYRLMAVLNGVKTRLLTGMLPALTKVTDNILEFFKANQKAIDSGLQQFLDVVITLVGVLAKSVFFLGERFSELSQLLGGSKNALYALGIAFVGFKLATSGVFIALLKNFTLAGAAATALNARILLLPILIAGVVTAIGLLLNDLYVFYKGGDSAIGRILDGLDDWKAKGEQVKSVMDAVYMVVDKIVTPMRELGELIGNTAGAIAVDKPEVAVSSIAGKAKDYLGFLTDFYTGGLFSNKGNELASNVGVINQRSGLPYSTNNNNQSEMKVDISVQSNDQVQPAVRGVLDSAQSHARNNSMNLINTETP